MAKFLKKAIEVDAVQVCHRNWREISEMTGATIDPLSIARSNECSDSCGETAPYLNFKIRTNHGFADVSHGDWLIKGISDIYPCNPLVFEQLYERISNGF
jgi:hypothetical protein